MNTKVRVGARVRAIRRQRGLSQVQLAEAAQRSVETISAIERGKSLPNSETLERFAEALGVRVQDFFSFHNAPGNVRRDTVVAEINASLIKLSDSELKLAADLIQALVARSEP